MFALLITCLVFFSQFILKVPSLEGEEMIMGLMMRCLGWGWSVEAGAEVYLNVVRNCRRPNTEL